MYRLRPTPEYVVLEFEVRHQIRLPQSYREYIVVNGGGVPKLSRYIDELRKLELFVGLVFDLRDEHMANQLFVFEAPAISGWLPVATDAGGDYFLLELLTGQVFYWDHEQHGLPPAKEEIMWLAPDFSSLMESLVAFEGETLEAEPTEKLAELGTIEELERFIAANGMGFRNSAGRTVAEECARFGRHELVARCVQMGAPLDRLLDLAAASQNVDLIVFLVEAGCPVNELNERGQSPLDRAIYRPVYDALLTLGAIHVRGFFPPHFR